ncbi:MAG: hypothetical protein R3B06_16510 [Kofleriaceae bacterium]
MRSLPALALTAALLIPSTAVAGRHLLGVSLGRTQTEQAAAASLDASATAGLWWRIEATRWLTVELALGKVSTQDDATRVRSFDVTGRVAVARLRHDTLVPQVLITLGGDSTSGYSEYVHRELGFGLDYQISDRFVVGGDFRFGDRSLTAQTAYATDTPGPILAREAYALDEGAYRAGRLYLGMRL